MAMGKRRAKQEPLFLSAQEIPQAASHPFYAKVNEILERNKVDKRLEHLCKRFYRPVMGRPSLPPGVYFRMLLVGYFEGIDSQRGIAWRCADSRSLAAFLGYLPTEATPDHSSLTKVRRRLPLAAHEQVFAFVLTLAEDNGRLDGRTVGVDATFLEANASLKGLRRRDTGDDYQAYLRKPA